MMMRNVLATTYHDPEGRLRNHITRFLPALQELYGEIVVRATNTTDSEGIAALRSGGTHVTIGNADEQELMHMGRARRLLLAQTQQLDSQHVHLCDFNRVLHWIAYRRDELEAVLAWLPTYDFVVLGRTERGMNSHPRVRRDTERMINFVYSQVSGDSWDVTAASRGISRRTVDLLVEQSTEDTIASDCTWPLLLRKLGGVSLGYWPSDGLEFEMADRYADDIAAVGGIEAWKARIDADPQEWVRQLELTRIEVGAMRAMMAGEALSKSKAIGDPNRFQGSSDSALFALRARKALSLRAT